MTTFVHAADIHLDSPLTGLSRYDGAPADEVREATRKALVRLVDYVLDEGAPLLLIAGDVYDGDWKDFQTGLFFVAQMARLDAAGVRVALVRGNHDAASVMTRALPLPPNVHVFDARAPETVVYDDLGLAVHGQSFETPDVQDNLVPAYPQAMPGMVNVGLLHTAVGGAEGHDRYAPCRVDELTAKGYDYWALGHVHQHAVLNKRPPVVFSGCMQGRNIRETGAKGCVRVDVEDGRVETNFVPLDVMRWERLAVDAEGAATPDKVGERFARTLSDALARAEGLPLAVRVEVTGRSEAHAALARDPEALRADLRARALALSAGRAWVEKVLVRTSLPVDEDALRAGDTPQGDLLRFLDALADDPEAFAEVRPDMTTLESRVRDRLAGSGVAMPDLGDEAVRRALLDDVRELVLPLFDTGEGA